MQQTFLIFVYKRLNEVDQSNLSPRQIEIYRLLSDDKGRVTKKEIADRLNVSEDTALRELNQMIDMGIVNKSGVGKATTYIIP